MVKVKAIIRGAYGEGNFGDDVLMIVCYQLLRRLYDEDQIAFLFGSRPATPERAYVHRLIPGIQIISLRSETRADLVVWGGGTQFFSFVQTQTSMNVTPLYEKVAKGLLDPKRAVKFLLRKVLRGKSHSGQRFAALAIGVGPFVKGSAEEICTRQLLARMDFVAVRDPQSLTLCRNWGVNHVTLHSDLCFLLDMWWPQGISARTSRTSQRCVGVIVRDWPHDAEGSAYSQPLWNVVDTLRGKGIDVRFISFRPHGDAGWMAMFSRRGEVALSWEPDRQSVSDFLKELTLFDCLLTARYHGALFGALLGKPVICIEVEQKLRLVSELLIGFLWRKPFREEECLALIERVFQEYGDLVAKTENVIASQRRLASAMQEEFLAFATARS